MTIPLSILKKHYPIKSVNVYFGSFAKDGSNHIAIVFYVNNDVVYHFCVSSKEKTRNRFDRCDSLAIIDLTPQEQDLFFDKRTPISFIYCGKENLGEMFIDEFYSKLSKKEIVFKKNIEQVTLFSKIILSVKNSDSYSEADLIKLGVIKS